jgi:deoxyadenosine/deoxycytidine kinase
MALEEFRLQIAMLLDEMSNQPEDMHELQESLREKLAEMQAMGLPLPDDLVNLEGYLEKNFEREAHRGKKVEDD